MSSHASQTIDNTNKNNVPAYYIVSLRSIKNISGKISSALKTGKKFIVIKLDNWDRIKNGAC